MAALFGLLRTLGTNVKELFCVILPFSSNSKGNSSTVFCLAPHSQILWFSFLRCDFFILGSTLISPLHLEYEHITDCCILEKACFRFVIKVSRFFEDFARGILYIFT